MESGIAHHRKTLERMCLRSPQRGAEGRSRVQRKQNLLSGTTCATYLPRRSPASLTEGMPFFLLFTMGKGAHILGSILCISVHRANVGRMRQHLKINIKAEENDNYSQEAGM